MLRALRLSLSKANRRDLPLSRKETHRTRPARPSLETLEDRCLLSATLPGGAAGGAASLPAFNPLDAAGQLTQQAIQLESAVLQSLLQNTPLGQVGNYLASLNPANALQQISQAAIQFDTAALRWLTDNTPLGQVENVLSAVDPAGMMLQMTQQTVQFESAVLQSFAAFFSPHTPVVTILGAPSSSPEGSTINLSSQVTENGQLLPPSSCSYVWSVSKNGTPYASGNQSNFSFTPDDTGTYVVNLGVRDQKGKTGTSSTTIVVTEAPPTVAITGVPSQVSQGTPINASSVVHDPSPIDQQAGFTYKWTVTANGAVVATGNQANFSYTPTAAGTYVFALTATDSEGQSGSAQQTVTVTAPPQSPPSPPSSLILLSPATLSSLQQEAASNTPQWQAFKAQLDQNLTQILLGTYQGSELPWIANYALGYQVLKNSDPLTAANYADKAIAIMKSGLNDYQKGGEYAQQFLTRGDGSTTTFTLPNSDLIPSTLTVYEAPVTTKAVVRGTSNADAVDYYETFLKVSNTPDGNADYVQGKDWIHDPSLPNNEIEWLPTGNHPAAGATYYVTEASSYGAPSVSYTLSGNTIKLATAPTTGQAIYVQYIYGTHSADGSTLAYQQTSAGDGGFNSILIDSTYTSRYLGKYEAMGLNWLQGYVGLSPALQNQAVNTLQQWFNWLPANGYYYTSPASNYGDGSYVSQVFTALALQGKTVDAPQMLADVIAYRQANVVPLLQNPTTSLNGGFWAEGWNYGQLAAENLLEAGLALEDAGQVTATAEHQWASQVVQQTIEASPSAGTIYDAGDWYAYPAPFPGYGGGDNDLFDALSAMASDPAEQAYANYVLQNNPNGNSNDAWDLLFRNPSAAASNWSNLPLQYFAQGTGLLTARSDWGSTPTWVSEQMGNILNADHQSWTPGQLQIQRGADDLLVNAPAVGEYRGGAKNSTYGNTIVVNDNGDGVQTYPYSMGYWYGSPGVTVTAYEAAGNHVYMAGNYAAAYSPATNPGSGGPVSELTREVVYLQSNYVVVYDRVTTLKDTYPKEQRWHFLNAPTVTGNAFVETVGNSRLFGQTFSTVPLTTTVAPVQVGNATVQELITQNSSANASVRYVTAFQTAPSSTSTADLTEHVLTTDSRMEGTQIGNQLVLFGRAAGTVDLTTPVTYSLSGSNSVSNLLVDLKAGGVYQIKVDGTTLGNVTASSQGTISFTTAAGAQQVTVTRVG